MENFFVKGFKRFLCLLFPKYITCCFCKEELEEKGLICGRCLKEISFIENGCGKCGSATVSGDYCVRCKSASFNFERAVAVCDYDDFAKNIIYKFKTGEKYLFEPLGFLMKDKIEKSGLCVDLLAYVPVTAKVLKKRDIIKANCLPAIYPKNLTCLATANFTRRKTAIFRKT